MRALILSLFVVLIVGGCASRPTQQEMAAADYGSYPSDYEQVIRNYMQRILKDPESARYEFLNQPQKAWTSMGGKKYGYAVCTYINSKNSFGGYVGNRLNYFLIKNGQVIAASHGDGDFGEAIAQGRCKAFIGG